MRNKWHFRDEITDDFSEIPAFRKKSSWQAPKNSWSPYVEVFLSQLWDDISNIKAQGSNYPNLTKSEREALKNLSEDKSIIIKPADKGSAVVVWDREDYIKEAQKQLDDQNVYRKVKVKADDKRIPDLAKKNNEFISELLSLKLISKQESEYLKWELLHSPQYARLFLLPKIHKRLNDVPGRPVISNCGAVTEKISEYLDSKLKILMQEGKSYLRDTDDFLCKIKSLGPLPKDAILVTADVAGLYPSIPHSDGLNALKYALNKRKKHDVPTAILIDMAEFVLTNNFFEFNNEFYQQISGTAMGTKFAPPYACLFMDWLEERFLETCEIKPWAYFRYIDDIFIIWTEGRDKLKTFLDNFNSFHPAIEFTWQETSPSNPTVEFLDVNLTIVDDVIEFDLYCKPTDCHQYLHFNSCHPDHTKNSIIYSQALRIRKRCSDDGKFENHLAELRQWFSSRKYPETLIEGQIQKFRAKVASNDPITEDNSRRDAGGVPLVMTYHPALKNTYRFLNKHIRDLYRNTECKAVFEAKPFISFRNCKTIKETLVRAKLPPLSIKKGTFKCTDKRCKTCKNLIVSADFVSKVTGKTYKINFELNCNSKSIIYLITCKICGIQYVGQTTRRWRERWNLYKQNQDLAKKGHHHQQPKFHEHFLASDHNGLLADAEVVLIDKTNPITPTTREEFWINALRTKHPLGLNIE